MRQTACFVKLRDDRESMTGWLMHASIYTKVFELGSYGAGSSCGP